MDQEETIIAIPDRIRFEQHLERASETVQSWPFWKQTILGGIQLSRPANGKNGCASQNVETESTSSKQV